MNFLDKKGNLLVPLAESRSANLLNGTKYTKENPYIISGTKTDNYHILDNYCQVTPGKTYYLLCSCYPGWAASHSCGEAGYGKGVFWLYLCKTFDASNTGYDSPIAFGDNSAYKVAEGVWKYTIPTGMNMARIRLNSYSDGTENITAKFWDIAVIPEENYAGLGAPAMRAQDTSISVDKIIEI